MGSKHAQGGAEIASTNLNPFGVHAIAHDWFDRHPLIGILSTPDPISQDV